MKTFKILMVSLVIILMFSCNVYASEIFSRGKEWLDIGEREAPGAGLGFATRYNKLEELAGVLFGAGVFVIVGAGMIIGAKYMLGSAEKRAELKRTLIIYCIGSVIILGALGIWRLLVNILQNIE